MRRKRFSNFQCFNRQGCLTSTIFYMSWGGRLALVRVLWSSCMSPHPLLWPFLMTETPRLNKETASCIKRKGGSGITLEFFLWRTIQLQLFLLSQSRAGWDWAGGGNWGVNAQLPLSSSWAEQGCGPHRKSPFLRVQTAPQILHRPSQQSPPITCLQELLPSFGAVGATGSCTPATLQSLCSVHNTSACGSQLHVQPRLHIHGERLPGAVCNLCASCSPWANTHGGGICELVAYSCTCLCLLLWPVASSRRCALNLGHVSVWSSGARTDMASTCTASGRGRASTSELWMKILLLRGLASSHRTG